MHKLKNFSVAPELSEKDDTNRRPDSSLVTCTGFRFYRNRAPVAILGVPPVGALAWLSVFDAPHRAHSSAIFNASY